MGKLPLFTPETATLEGGTHGELIKAIACCHSLTRIDGVLTGTVGGGSGYGGHSIRYTLALFWNRSF